MEAISLPPAARPAGPPRRTLSRNLFRWHRLIGLVTVVPVIFWTLSGLMHPFMSHWFKPSIPHEKLASRPLNRAALAVPIERVLTQNGIARFRSFRVVAFAGTTYYQVTTAGGARRYFGAADGRAAPAATDRAYAEWMARYFLADSVSPVRAAEVVTRFGGSYKYINRLLPVWRIELDRPDATEVYVETGQGRLATFNNDGRKAFITVFDLFHNWSWVERVSASNTVRVVVMSGFLSVILLSTLSGLLIYGLFWQRFRRPPPAAGSVGWLRTYHRQIGLAVSLVTLTFAGSGLYHVLGKLTPDDRMRFVAAPLIETRQLATASLGLPVDWAAVTNLSVVKLADKVYYQVFSQGPPAAKSGTVAYYDAATGKPLPQGTEAYGQYLGQVFWRQMQAGPDALPDCCTDMGPGPEAAEAAPAEAGTPALLSTAVLTAFDREYGFVNKRLPVVKLTYATPTHTALYVEPATGRLAARIEDGDRREGFTFAVLHKYFLMDWAGKNVRDAVMMLAAAGVLVVSLFGLVLFLKVK